MFVGCGPDLTIRLSVIAALLARPTEKDAAGSKVHLFPILNY
jgi:hypothetical protein